MLGLAALGSGAAILRAIAAALATALATRTSHRPESLAAVALLFAAGLTATGLPIIDTMVSVNVIYIASVGVSLLAMLRVGLPMCPSEHRVMEAGLLAAAATYFADWAGGWESVDASLLALLIGLTAAAATRQWLLRRYRRKLFCGPAHR